MNTIAILLMLMIWADDSTARQIADQVTQQNMRQYADDEQMLVKPGGLADRKAKTITLWGAATGLAGDEACEFFLIHDHSGKDYEALAIAFAKPSDVDAGLKFIGMTPGRPVDHGQLMFWPKGERVVMRFQWTDETGTAHDVRAEDLILDLRTNKPLERTGLVYVGSRWGLTENGERIMAADSGDVGCIASTYNEPTTLLDVPRRAEQVAVYGLFKPKGEYKFSGGQPITITIGPERTEGPPRVVDLSLQFGISDFKLMDSSGAVLNEERTLPGVLAALGELSEQQRDPFVSVEPAPGVPLEQVQQVSRLLDAIEVDHGIRIEPPGEGHLYYRAFLPDPQWRDRSNRPLGGWELHVGVAEDNAMQLKLLEIHQSRDEQDQPVTIETPHEAHDAASLAKVLADTDANRPRNLYVFAPHDLEYGRLCDLLADVPKTRRTIYVFLPTGP